MDRSIPYGFSRVSILYTERLQSRKELVCVVQRASYSCGEIGLRGFPAAFLPVAEVVDEAYHVKGEAVRSEGYKCVDVCIVEVDGVGGEVFFDVFPE